MHRRHGNPGTKLATAIGSSVQEVSSQSVVAAVESTFVGELAHHAAAEVKKAKDRHQQAATSRVLRCSEGNCGSRRCCKAHTQAAGLQFPVLIARTHLAAHIPGSNAQLMAAVSCAAVLEYITAELLDLGVNAALAQSCISTVKHKFHRVRVRQ